MFGVLQTVFDSPISKSAPFTGVFESGPLLGAKSVVTNILGYNDEFVPFLLDFELLSRATICHVRKDCQSPLFQRFRQRIPARRGSLPRER